MIICGSCKGRHGTSQEVKACYGSSGVAVKEFDPQDVPPGRYALENNDGQVRFFKVDHGDGKWEGYVFVDELFGAPGSFRKLAVKGKGQRHGVLRKILRDVDEAAQRFGQELGVCAMCGSPLTNEESRAYGIGPVCRGKM